MLPVETGFPLDPSHFLETLGGKWAWQPIVFFGLDFTQGLPFVTYYGLLAILNAILNIPAALLQRIWSILLVALGGWSMYFLTTTIIPSTTRQRRVAAIVSASFYMYNPWLIAVMRAATISPYVFTVSMTPLFLGLLIRGLHSHHNQIIFGILLAFSSLSQVLGIQLFLHQAVFPAVLYFLFYIVTCGSKKKAIRAFRFGGLTTTLTFLINLWWIIPSAFDLTSIYTQQVGNIAERTVNSVSYLNIFRLYLDSWPFESYFQSSLGVVIGIVLAIAAYSTLLMYRKRSHLRKHVNFFVVLALIGSALMAGANLPFGSLYKFILQDVPGGMIFLPHDAGKFGTVLLIPYAFLLGAAAAYLTGFLGKANRFPRYRFRFPSFTPALVICVLIGLNSSPLLTGNLGGLISPVEIPNYYGSTENWLNEQNGEFRLFVLPSPYLQGQTKYVWAPYSMSDIVFQLPKQPVTDWPSSLLLGKDIVRLVQSKILSCDNIGTGELLGLMNIKYIMLRTDLDSQFHGQYDFESINAGILESEEFHDGPSFGSWAFYENERFSERIFPSELSFSIVGDVNTLASLAKYDFCSLNSSAVFFLEDMDMALRRKALELSEFVIIDKLEVEKDLEAEILSSNLRQAYVITPEVSQLNVLEEGRFFISLFPSRNNGSEQMMDGHRFFNLSNYQLIQLSAGVHNITIGTNILMSAEVTGYNGMQVETQDSGSESLVKGYLTSPAPTTYGITLNNPNSSWNLAGVEAIHLSVYLNNTRDMATGVAMYDEIGNWRQWAIPTPQARSWSEVAVHLNSPSVQSEDEIDMTRIRRLMFYAFIGSPQVDSYQITIGKVGGASGQALLISSNSENEQIEDVFQKQSSVRTDFTKINPTLYKVHVKADSPFVLVFSNSYHPMWKVSINGRGEFDPLPINSYANGFFIDEVGDYELTIEFIVQRYAALGGSISIVAAMDMVALIILTQRRFRIILRVRFKGKLLKRSEKSGFHR